MTDVVGVWVGAILTLLVFSYLLGDTPLFRLAQAIFVGVAVGYATTVAVYLVLIPRLVYPLAFDPGTNWPLFIPLILGLLLLLKLRTTWAPLGNSPIAFLFGVGGALAIGGALSGALLPQLGATLVSLSPAQGWETVASNVLLVVGTIGAFLSFRFITGAQRPAARALDTLGRGWGYFGRWFILIAFGAIFAGTAVSRVSILINRVYYLMHDWLQVVR
ncbi:MAG: hypothetical protein HY782_01240 [Chloroflexi bacterium]|nr:hypothetical protein [Chloroflexota bacterium]